MNNYSFFRKNIIGGRYLLLALCLVLLQGLIGQHPAFARLPYSRKEDKKCYYCHADWKNAPKLLTEQGQWYADHELSFEGMPAELVAGPPEPAPVEEAKKKGPPVGVIIGMGFFVAMIGMIVVSIFKAPVKDVAPAAEEEAGRYDPGSQSDVSSDITETNGHLDDAGPSGKDDSA